MKVSITRLLLTLLLIGLVTRISIRKVIWTWDYTVEQRVMIKDTFWVAEVRSNRCVFSCNGYQGVDIRLIDRDTGESHILVAGADVLTDELSSNASGELKITLSNLTVARVNDLALPSIHVMWNFVPKDDPIARSANKLWLAGDKTLENNRFLFCRHVFPGISSGNEEALDKNIAGYVYGPKSRRLHYCVDS